MRILLLHPEDSPLQGPWSRQRWDLIIDLGKASPFSEATWSGRCGCQILRADSFRHGIADAKQTREVFSAGKGHLIDRDGIDWWDLLSLAVAGEAFSLFALRRIAANIPPDADLWATRRGQSLRILESLLDCSLHYFGDSGLARMASRGWHYAGLFRRFSVAEMAGIFLDKYDPGYRWRRHFSVRQGRCTEPVVLLPSAYVNSSRMASAYARLLPAQSFLMVATRRSAKQFVPPPNVQVRDLAAYAVPNSRAKEVGSLVDRWRKLRKDLSAIPELRALIRAGVFDGFPARIRDGVRAGNAWREVLEREPVHGVFCGDDSNLYTRLPVLLAAGRGIPTVDFHHGALDGVYVLKELSCDLYLAKNDMERDYLLRVCALPPERVVIGAPPKPSSVRNPGSQPRTAAVLFSEPYEVAGVRAEEVYRELLPHLCRLVRGTGRRLIVKLHPFESLSQRRRLVRQALPAEDQGLVTVLDGPLTPELMAEAWFGITIESTTVIDCLRNGVCCFLCGWLSLSPFEYAKQYARFGIGEILEDAEQIADIPQRLAEFDRRATPQLDLSPTTDAAMLQRWLTTRESSATRAAS